MAETCKGKVCPRLSAVKETICIEHRCADYQQVLGNHPQTDEPLGYWDCAARWQNILIIENSAMQRQTGAAVESFRNEGVNNAKAIAGAVSLLASSVQHAAPAGRTLEAKPRSTWSPIAAFKRLTKG